MCKVFNQIKMFQFYVTSAAMVRGMKPQLYKLNDKLFFSLHPKFNNFNAKGSLLAHFAGKNTVVYTGNNMKQLFNVVEQDMRN